MKKADVPVGQHYSEFLLTLNLYSSKERLPQIYYPGKLFTIIIQEPFHFCFCSLLTFTVICYSFAVLAHSSKTIIQNITTDNRSGSGKVLVL